MNTYTVDDNIVYTMLITGSRLYIISSFYFVAEPTDHSVPRSNGASDIIIVGPQGGKRSTIKSMDRIMNFTSSCVRVWSLCTVWLANV
jgi:hypothetical protein